MYGKIVRVGVKYYVVPLLQNQGGGLDLASTGSHSCPQSVVQDDAYWWGNTMQFYLVDPKKGVVREWSDLNIEFPDAYTGCPENNVWMIVGDLSVYDDSHYITAGGEKGNPSSQTLNNWFKIVKTTNAYKLMSCPDVCYYCSYYCRDVGISVEAGQRPSGYGSVIPDAHGVESHSSTKALAEKVGNYLDLYIEAMEKIKLKQGLKIAMSLSGEGNAYLQNPLLLKIYDTNLIALQSLYVHLPARHPPSYPEFELPTLLQRGIAENQTPLSSFYQDANILAHI
nr:kunitz trypsin inhibitor 2-like [Ipomoea batatas]